MTIRKNTFDVLRYNLVEDEKRKKGEENSTRWNTKQVKDNNDFIKC